MKRLVVIPTFNEKDNIVELIKAIFEVTPQSHILVVDDGSPDGTGEIVEGISKTDPRVHLLKRATKQGLGKAYVAGFRWGMERGYEFFTEMDADWSHPPRYLADMYRHSETNDFVIGSRYVRGGGAVNWKFSRRMISKFGSIYARTILGVPINDFTGGFNGWHRRVLEGIDLETIGSDGYSFQIEIKYRGALCGFRFVEFPILFEERREGQSKMSSRIIREAMWRVWLLRLNKSHILNQVSSTSRLSNGLNSK